MVTFYPGALEELLNSPRGPVGQHLKARTRLFIAAARRQVGVETGRLRMSIHADRHVATPYGQSLRVGSTVEYALMHHEGTRPHVILSNTGRIMTFSSNGKVIATREVHHPGTPPNRFLSDNLYIYRR